MAAPYSNLRSKNDRAIVAYLIGANCGTANDIFPGNFTADKKSLNTVVRSTLSMPEENFTGNRRVKVLVHIKGPATVNDDSDPRAAFDARVSATMDALMQTDNEQDLQYTADTITSAGRATSATDPDMADYTCQSWYEAGEGDGEDTEDGCLWHTVLMFECVACPSAIG